MASKLRVVRVGGGERWDKVALDLAPEGFGFEALDLSVDPVEVAERCRGGDAVLVVDLSADLVGGIGMVSACRRAAPAVPVVAVAENPSLDLARSIRAAGVFYLAHHPLESREVQTILEDAFRSIGRNKPSASSCKTRKKVVVVEDDPDFRATVTTLLEAEDCVVACAASAKEGLERIAAEKPDLIVLDVIMEDDWSGYTLNQAMKHGERFAAFKDVPILMVSSISRPPNELFPLASEAGMITPDLYMTKPLDIPVFLANVRRLLGRGRKK